jgi:hypothetical protein
LPKRPAAPASHPLIELFAPNARVSVPVPATPLEGWTPRPSSEALTPFWLAMLPKRSRNYELRLAQTPETFVVPPGMKVAPCRWRRKARGSITLGDLDLGPFRRCRRSRQHSDYRSHRAWRSCLSFELFDPNGDRKKFARLPLRLRWTLPSRSRHL